MIVRDFALNLARPKGQGFKDDNILIPEGSKLLGLSLRYGVPTLYFAVDPENEVPQSVRIRLVMSGRQIDPAENTRMEYIGTVHAVETWHVFQEIPDAVVIPVAEKEPEEPTVEQAAPARKKKDERAETT